MSDARHAARSIQQQYRFVVCVLFFLGPSVYKATSYIKLLKTLVHRTQNCTSARYQVNEIMYDVVVYITNQSRKRVAAISTYMSCITTPRACRASLALTRHTVQFGDISYPRSLTLRLPRVVGAIIGMCFRHFPPPLKPQRPKGTRRQ